MSFDINDRKKPIQTSRKKSNPVVILCIVAVVIAAMFIVPVAIKKINYSKAVSCQKQGDYAQAIQLYDHLGYYYEDAYNRKTECCYLLGCQYMTEGQWRSAQDMFTRAGSYQDADTRRLEAYYREGEELLAAEDYKNAVSAFAKARDYQDAATRKLEICFTRGQQLMAQEDYTNAAKWLEDAGDYPGAAQLAAEAHYLAGMAYKASANYSGAMQQFTAAGDYPGAEELAKQCAYALGQQYLAQGKYSSAANAFAKAGNYLDAAERVKGVHYDMGMQYYEAGIYDQAQEYFTMAGDYSDAAAWLVKSEEAMLNVEPFPVVTFGHYEQDAVMDNGKQPIEWLVIAQEEDRVLLLSRYVLDYRPQVDSASGAGQTAALTNKWYKSSIRTWLNDTFRVAAFTPQEIAAIIIYDTKADETNGQDTSDYVFLLSRSEVNQYLPMRSQRFTTGTVYSCSHKLGYQAGVYLWQKETGKTMNEYALLTESGNVLPYAETAITAAYKEPQKVPQFWSQAKQMAEDNLSWWTRSKSYIVSANSGDLVDGMICYVYYGVRPAIWVKKDAVGY